jgi:hypothetical protein
MGLIRGFYVITINLKLIFNSNNNIKMTDTSFDYTLTIELERCSLIELREIAKCLVSGGTSMCLHDFYDLVKEMIKRMRKVGENMRERENIPMVKFIKDISETLKNLNRGLPPTQLMIIIQREFNEFMGFTPRSPVSTPVTSPEVKPPTFMKKAKRRFKN